MAITFRPRAGMVFMCDFRGTIAPEISKRRPVVVISPDYVWRWKLVTVVPLSTARPERICGYHYRLTCVPFPGAVSESWAKCDLVMSVAHDRLDRIPVSTECYVVGHVNFEDLFQIRIAAAHSFGVDASRGRA